MKISLNMLIGSNLYNSEYSEMSIFSIQIYARRVRYLKYISAEYLKPFHYNYELM